MKRLFWGVQLLGMFAFMEMQFASAQVSMSWFKRDYSTFGSKQRDYGLNVASDGAANYYVSGIASGRFILLKYSNLGTLIWVREYSGTLDQNSFQENGIRTDGMGNVYCFFSTGNMETDIDWILQKYDTTGNLIWTRIYDSGSYDSDLSAAIEIDFAGNVIIAGNYNNISSDIRIMKISPAGSTIWSYSPANTSSFFDRITDIVLDASGNVYYTGISVNIISTTYDLTAGKLNANGALAWDYNYNGPFNGSEQGNAIGLDPMGNVIITGSGYITMTAMNDAVVIKLSPAGVFTWLYNFNHTSNNNESGEDIECDINGNIYVSGNAYDVNGMDNYMTLKVSSLGSLVWSRLYPATFGGSDYIRKMTMDANGNVLVTGICVNGSNGNDAVTIKYDPQGNSVWINAYNNGSNNPDEGKYVIVDPLGNIVVVGIAFDTTSYEDVFITKINQVNGQTIWSQKYGSQGNLNQEQLSDLITDKCGYIYAAGTRKYSSGLTDILVSRYDPAGNLLWTRTYSGLGGGNDVPMDLAVDTLCNLYVGGYTYTSSMLGTDMLILKYDQTGSLLWNNVYGQNLTDLANAIIVNDSGHVYVAGYVGSSSFGPDYVIRKLRSNGTSRWVRTIPSSVPNGFDQAVDIAFADSGRAVITAGSMVFGPTGKDIYTAKIDTSGNPIWTASFNNIGGLHDAGQFIRLDSSQNIIVVGAVSGNSGYADHCVLQYDQNGSLNWNHISGTSLDDSIRSATLDQFGNVFITGFIEQSTTGRDVSTKKINTAGNLVWNTTYSSQTSNPDEGFALLVDSTGKVYVVAEIDDTLHGGNIIHILSYDSAGQLTDSLLFHSASFAKPKDMIFTQDQNGFYWSGFGTYQMNEDGLLVKYCINSSTLTLGPFITAPASVCAGSSNVVYSVNNIPNAYYNWSYSGSGVTIINNGTSSTLSFSQLASSGVLTVYASTSNCYQSNALSLYINVSPCTGIFELPISQDNFTLFPNPASQEVFVSVPDHFLLEILNINGQILRSEKVQPGINRINCSGLAIGFYLVKIVGNQSTHCRPLIITRI